MAERELVRHGGDLTLGASTLLHQTYLDMAQRSSPLMVDEAKFMGYACRVMRGVIIDYARSRNAQKRGGQFVITSLTTNVAEAAADETELERISDALDELGKFDAPLSELVDLKFFCVCGDRRDEMRLRENRTARLGTGPHLSPSEYPARFGSLSKRSSIPEHKCHLSTPTSGSA